MCRSSLLVQDMCFLFATHPFGGKNLYRELEIGGRRVILSAIHPFCRNTLCRVQRKGAVAYFRQRYTFFEEIVCVASMEWGISGKTCSRYTLFLQIGCVAGYDICSEGYNVCSWDYDTCSGDYNVCSYGVCCGSCNVCCSCPVARKLLRRNLHYGYPP